MTRSYITTCHRLLLALLLLPMLTPSVMAAMPEGRGEGEGETGHLSDKLLTETTSSGEDEPLGASALPAEGAEELCAEINDLNGEDDTALFRRHGGHWGCDFRLRCAIEENDANTVVRLLEEGADPTLKYGDGKGYLHTLAREGFVELLPLLLPRVVPALDVMRGDDEKEPEVVAPEAVTPLVEHTSLWHLFIGERASLATLQALLIARGDALLTTLDHLNEGGQTALDCAIATYGGDGDVTRWLKEHGALRSSDLRFRRTLEQGAPGELGRLLFATTQRLEGLAKELTETRRELEGKLTETQQELAIARRAIDYLDPRDSYTLCRTLTGHGDAVWGVAFSPDGAWIASGSYDCTVRLWNARTGEHIRTLTGHEDEDGVTSVAFSPDGACIASGSYDKTVRLWNARTGEFLRILTGHQDWVVSVAFAPCGRAWIASGSYDKTVRLWNATTGEHLRTLTGHRGSVTSVAFAPCGSADGAWIASGSDDRTIRLWNARTGELLCTLTGHANQVWSVAFAPDGAWIASGSLDRTIRLWNARTGKHLRTLTGHTSYVRSVAFSPDGAWIASGSDDKTIRLWNARTGEHIRTLMGDTHRTVYSVAFAPDGACIASGSLDKIIRLWKCSSAWAMAEKLVAGRSAAADEEKKMA